MISQIFIDRPKFALVISIVITIAGLISLAVLPVAQYPDITPPQVQVTASYPGANAGVVEKTVAAPIEAQVNGVDDMIYMSSSSDNNGSYTLTVTFRVGTDANLAAVNVQNRVALAMPSLPQEVQRQGVPTKKQSTATLLAVNLISPNGTYDGLFLSNYASINVRDALVRIDGVGDAALIGDLPYGMRVWLDPMRLTALSLTAQDVIGAISEQNRQASAGQLGAAPSPSDQQFQYTLRAEGGLTTVKQFEDVIVRANPNGSQVRVRDVATVELGSQSYSAYAELNGMPSAMIMVYQAPGANALGVADAVREELDRLSERFPEDLSYAITYDTTRFVQASVDEVVKTLVEAMVLVIIVVFLFMQDWRATLIPTIAVPVSLIGTFAVMLVAGFSINTISLFGLILAIGIVVDDAIIVVENVQAIMQREKLSAKDATRKAMRQITGPIIATTLVLVAVFAPTAFLPGIIGQLYQQFAVTISVAVVISSINALTLSPALAALLLRDGHSLAKRGPLHWFNLGFEKVKSGYVATVIALLRRWVIALLLLVGVYAGAGGLFQVLPGGFLPSEDQGYFIVDVQLPDGASLNRTAAVVEEVRTIVAEETGVADVLTATGYSMVSGAVSSNAGLAIAVLAPWGDRPSPENHVEAIIERVQGRLFAIAGANAFAFNAPPIPGLGATGGLDLQVQDLGGSTPQALASASGALIYDLNQSPAVGGAFSTYRANVPQILVNVDRQKAEVLGVPISDIFTELQANLGSYYINDFSILGRNFRVMVQADAAFRSKVGDIESLHVRGRDGAMVPLRTLVSTETVLGPEQITRYNLFRAAKVTIAPPYGGSSGDTLTAGANLADAGLPQGFGYEWTGTALEQISAGSQAIIAFSLAIVFGYLFLVAQYESWSMPAGIMLSVPVAVLGALLGVLMSNLDINAYTQIGLVMLIGMAAKNAILIVEFAAELRASGKSVFDASLEAASLRFRAVMMTAVAFLLGVVPLMIATGAGAASRVALGVTVFYGMLAATVVGVCLVPALYFMLQHMRERVKGQRRPPALSTE